MNTKMMFQSLNIALVIFYSLLMSACPFFNNKCKKSCDCCDSSMEICRVKTCQSLTSCNDSEDCQPGVKCILYDIAKELDEGDNKLAPTSMGTHPNMVCDPGCSPKTCPGGFRCLLGKCQPPECDFSVPCKDPLKLCDPWVKECYQFNGSCKVLSECPQFDSKIYQEYELSCKDGFCRIGFNTLVIPDLEMKKTIPIVAPTVGASFQNEKEIKFLWEKQENSTIALVLKSIPASLAELKQTAIWGASMPPGFVGELRWDQGQAITDGVWSPGSIGAPQNTILYFLVQAVTPGELIAVSHLISFIVNPSKVGKVGRAVNDSCDTSCEGLSQPLVCYKNTCRALCASDRDCVPLSLTCSDRIENMRICE